MEKVEMHVPNKSYNGYYGGVQFVQGVGIFTDIEVAKDLAARYGYEIVEIKDAIAESPIETATIEEVEVKPTPKVEPKPKRTRKATAKAGE